MCHHQVWLRAIDHSLLTGGEGAGERARRLLERALAALPRRKHVKVISHAALLEFKHGSPERGRSVMEGVLQNYPKRLDLWSVYIDQEVKHGGVDQVRGLYARATSLALPPKKMKLLFRRWLEWEQGRADDKGVAEVKRRAMEYVERTSGGGA
jgi:rRNA biogenesis protein RRP5